MRGYAAIGLNFPKDHFNIGAVLRAAGCYDAKLVLISGNRYRKVNTDTQASYRQIPVISCEDLHDVIPYDCVPVAVDLVKDATSLPFYQHPERAFYIFGPEDSTLGEKTLSWCRDRIYVPTQFCMNLAATVNVILYDRLMKSLFQAEVHQAMRFNN